MTTKLKRVMVNIPDDLMDKFKWIKRNSHKSSSQIFVDALRRNNYEVIDYTDNELLNKLNSNLQQLNNLMSSIANNLNQRQHVINSLIKQNNNRDLIIKLQEPISGFDIFTADQVNTLFNDIVGMVHHGNK